MSFGFILFCLQLFICQIAILCSEIIALMHDFSSFWGIFFVRIVREYKNNVYICGRKGKKMRERVTINCVKGAEIVGCRFASSNNFATLSLSLSLSHILYSSDKGYTFSNIYARLRRVLASLGNDAGEAGLFFVPMRRTDRQQRMNNKSVLNL